LARWTSRIPRTRHRRRLHSVCSNLRFERRDCAGDGDNPDPSHARARLSTFVRIGSRGRVRDDRHRHSAESAADTVRDCCRTIGAAIVPRRHFPGPASGSRFLHLGSVRGPPPQISSRAGIAVQRAHAGDAIGLTRAARPTHRHGRHLRRLRHGDRSCGTLCGRSALRFVALLPRVQLDGNAERRREWTTQRREHHVDYRHCARCRTLADGIRCSHAFCRISAQQSFVDLAVSAGDQRLTSCAWVFPGSDSDPASRSADPRAGAPPDGRRSGPLRDHIHTQYGDRARPPAGRPEPLCAFVDCCRADGRGDPRYPTVSRNFADRACHHHLRAYAHAVAS
jgi:hypothetical protein